MQMENMLRDRGLSSFQLNKAAKSNDLRGFENVKDIKTLEVEINEEKSYHPKFARCLPPEQRGAFFPSVPSNINKQITPLKPPLPREE